MLRQNKKNLRKDLLRMKEPYEIQPCATHGIYVDSNGYTSSNLKNLTDLKLQVNDDAVLSVLQYGAIIPPLSPWLGIRRLLPGYKYFGTDLVGPVELNKLVKVSESSDLEYQADEVARLFDKILLRLIGDQKDPILMFSGGVDSGFLASRLAVLGYRDSLLLNYSFGERDEESRLAEAMAKRLNLKFERVSFKSNLCSCLKEPGSIYPQPFGDYSTVQALDLAYGVLHHSFGSKRLILDGTGADDAFGAFKIIDKWENVYKVPVLIRKIASSLYAKTLWHSEGSIEYYSRIFRRSLEMPMISAIWVQNPLEGIFYRRNVSSLLDQLVVDWIGPWAGELQANRIVASDLALGCANVCAQKAIPILEAGGHTVSFPFLEKESVAMALAIASGTKWKMDEKKAPLKKSLARYIPREMVYRPKSGFTDPKQEVFYQKEFIEYLHSAVESTSPIGHLLIRKPILDACQFLENKKKLPCQTLNLLWAIVFTDRWYRTVHNESSKALRENHGV